MENKNNFCQHCGQKLEKDEKYCKKCSKETGNETESSNNTNITQTKQCKKCKEKISQKAKKCPKCGARQGMRVWAIVLIVLGSFIVLGGLFSDKSKLNESKNDSSVTTTNQSTTKAIEYTKVSIDDLEDELEKNAAAAKEKYNNKHLEITGKLGTIDSDLKYISVVSETNEWDLTGIHCTNINECNSLILTAWFRTSKQETRQTGIDSPS